MQQVKKIILASMVAMSVISSAEVNASAFQIWEQDEAGLGSAHSGGAAEANSASTSYYNPAGMVRLDRPEMTTGIALIYPLVSFNGTLTRYAAGFIVPTQLNNEQGGKKILPVPNFHAVLPFEISGHKAAVGFSMVSVFDAFTEWADRGDPLENAADISSIKTVTAGPTFGFSVTDKFSIGAGVGVSYAFNEVSQGVDFGATEFGYVDNNFSGFGVSGHVGVMYQFSEKTRVGVTYFSPITYHMDGTSKGTTPIPSSKSVDTSQTWTFPEYVIASIFHNYEKFDFMGTVTWTHWSRIQSLQIESLVPDAGTSPTAHVLKKEIVNINQKFKDTFAIMLGTNYHYSEKFTYKFGLGFDMSPTNDTARNLQLPDSNRLMASLGFQYRPFDDVIFDLGYMYVYALPTTLNYTAPPGVKVMGTGIVKNDIKGDINASAHVFGAQLTLKF
jgi:long-chain fatty acid transport protein